MKIVGQVTETAGERTNTGRYIIRTIECEECHATATSSHHWTFGVLDRHTHLAALREVLGSHCGRVGCRLPRNCLSHLDSRPGRASEVPDAASERTKLGD